MLKSSDDTCLISRGYQISLQPLGHFAWDLLPFSPSEYWHVRYIVVLSLARALYNFSFSKLACGKIELAEFEILIWPSDLLYFGALRVGLVTGWNHPHVCRALRVVSARRQILGAIWAENAAPSFFLKLSKMLKKWMLLKTREDFWVSCPELDSKWLLIPFTPLRLDS